MALRRHVQLLDPVVGQDGSVRRALRRGAPGRDRHRPRSARRCRPSSPTPTTSRSRLRSGANPVTLTSSGTAQARPSRRAVGGPPAGGAARAAGGTARHPRPGRWPAGRDRGDRRAQRRGPSRASSTRPSSSPAASSSTLSDDEKLTGPTFEPFPAGVIVGSAGYVAVDAMARDVAAGFETVRLDPEPDGLVSKWTTARCRRSTGPPTTGRMHASKLGAAARSGPRRGGAARWRRRSPPPSIGVDEPPLALVAREDDSPSRPSLRRVRRSESPSLGRPGRAAAGGDAGRGASSR